MAACRMIGPCVCQRYLYNSGARGVFRVPSKIWFLGKLVVGVHPIQFRDILITF